MATINPAYDDLLKYKILKAAEVQCCPVYSDGHQGSAQEGSEAVRLNVEGLTSDEISTCCARLSEMGLLEVVKFREASGMFVYPIKLTNEGVRFLKQTDRDLFESLEEYAIDLIKNLTKVDLKHPVFNILRLAFNKYLQSRSIESCTES